MKRVKDIQADVRYAGAEDIDEITDLLFPGYFEESIYFGNMTATREFTRRVIEGFVAEDDVIGYVVVAEERIVGFAAMRGFKSFYEELELDIEFYFIHPRFRGGGCSRLLNGVINEEAKRLDAGVVYAAAGSGLDDVRNDGFWRNMFGKLGFKHCGSIMAKFYS